MTALITSDNTFTMVTGKAPEVGKKYILEPMETGTAEQGRAFHALIQEFWRTGLHSFDVTTFDDFRDMVKAKLGAGFDAVLVATIEDGKVVQKKYRSIDEVPVEIRKDKTSSIFGRVKSWSEYTKKERTETIDRIISTMHQAGVNTKKFEEIIEGMGANQ